MVNENTRRKILEAAQQEMYEHGFQGMRIESILQKTQLAKGALYHYFPSKLAIGYAVVDEILFEDLGQRWDTYLQVDKDPIEGLKQSLRDKAASYQNTPVFNGCPCNNLAQEMAAIDAGFADRLQGVMSMLAERMAKGLRDGQENGFVRKDIDVSCVVLFLLSCYQGIMGTAKCMQSPQLLQPLFEHVFTYLETLRDTRHESI